MWSSRISILKTVLEMADIWQFANKKKTNLSQRACKMEDFPKDRKAFGDLCELQKGGNGHF